MYTVCQLSAIVFALPKIEYSSIALAEIVYVKLGDGYQCITGMSVN